MPDRSPADLVALLRGPVTAATQRLIAGAFRRDGERLESRRTPRFSIPCRPDADDDVVVLDALRHAAARIERLEAELARARPQPVPVTRTERLAPCPNTPTSSASER
jgi:hypothetical protein